MKIKMITSVVTYNYHYVGGETYEVGNLISEDLANTYIKNNFAKIIEEEDNTSHTKKFKKKVVKNIED